MKIYEVYLLQKYTIQKMVTKERERDRERQREREREMGGGREIERERERATGSPLVAADW